MFIAVPTSNAGDQGSNCQLTDNRQRNLSNSESQPPNSAEPLASPSAATKKGSFFKKNVEDGMDRSVI